MNADKNNQAELPMTAETLNPSDCLQFMVTWIPASEPPTVESETGVYCVSTPASSFSKHQLACWDARGWWVSAFPPKTLLEGVTYWCHLPYSPEWQATHPDDFVECDCNDHPTELKEEKLLTGGALGEVAE